MKEVLLEKFDSYKKVYGLTGSIACGKTTVAKFFEKYGITVVDLDNVAREVVKKGEKGLKLIIEKFGKEYITDTGELNRKKLGELIFKDKKAKETLESILHPLIFKWERNFLENFRKNSDTPIIIDAALMIESGSYKRYNKIIVVYVPEKIQIQRLMKRENLSFDEAVVRIKSQMSIENKKEYADFIIDNSKDLNYTEQQVRDIVEVLK